MEGRVICAFSDWLLERQRRERWSKGVRESGSRLGRGEEGKERMRDGWLTQSLADV